MGTAVLEHRGGGAGSGPPSASMAKSITRMLQHSILQLCNEHIGYSHKLQILGVLCMTVDDEQQELVVKVNNTLKRVAPQVPKEIPSPHLGGGLASVPPDVRAQHIGQAVYHNSAMLHNGTRPSLAMPLPNPLIGAVGEPADLANEGEGSSTPLSQTRSNSPSNSQGGGGRRSHGRKRSKPVKVHHVYDEGEMIDEGDGDVLTVIPTDPDNPDECMAPTPKTIYQEDFSDDDEEDLEEIPRRKPPIPRHHVGHSKHISTASPNVRALLQQSIARHRAAANNLMEERPSQLRSALLNGAPRLQLPICVAPEEVERAASTNSSAMVEPMMNGDMDDDDDDDGLSGSLQIDEGQDDEIELARAGEMDSAGHLNDSMVSVKDEPRDDYDWSTAGQVSNIPQDLSAAARSIASLNSCANAFPTTPFTAYTIAPTGLEGVSSLPNYSGLSLALTTANLQLPLANNSQTNDGLTIRYTPTGPITVGANGKNVSQQKVKDIIMYDDQSPLSQQKGARLETDYMVDKMGMEGRKRRRRAPDETLTAEEIGEYMGAASNSSVGIGHGMFKCKYCTVEVEELVQYLQHTLAAHNAYICHQCGKSFTTKSSLLRHRPIHTGMRRFACSICKKTFYRKDKCKAHIKRHLGSNGEVQAEIGD